MKVVPVITAVVAMLLVAADKPTAQRWTFEDAKVGGVPKGCEAMDLDADDDVDLIDHTIWATMMTGPG